jgi:hypothetical protein
MAPMGGSERSERGGNTQFRPAAPKVLMAPMGGSERSERGGGVIATGQDVRFVVSFAMQVFARTGQWPRDFTIH